MTKGKKLDEATKNVIRAEVREAARGKNGMTKKQIAELPPVLMSNRPRP